MGRAVLNRLLLAPCVYVALLQAVPVLKADDAFDRDAALSVSQAAIGEAIGAYTLRDTDGQPFQMQSLSGRPYVLSMIYTSCHHVCPLITRRIASNVEIAREALGDEAFAVVTVGFDWRVDTPERMRLYRRNMGAANAAWHFLSGDDGSIRSLTEDTGFQFTASSGGFEHLSQTTIVDANGRIYRQIYGDDFKTQAFVEPLKELVLGNHQASGFVQSWIDTVKLFCTVYDPNSGRYAFDYSIFVALLTGILCLGAVLIFIVREWRIAR
ncbi:MAG: SCO family protein [Gammaproteobacteria bacterium]|nr:SCO family protein [Gammaproteobacteria bacterium]